MGLLLSTRRFLPLFLTQFLGAFHDNLFKNAMVILVTYRIAAENSTHGAMLVNIAYGLFILPFFLFSPLAGQLADKIDRARIARLVKVAEVGLAIVGGAGVYLQSLPLLLFTLFGFGTHSTFFGPVKYAMLPQHLRDNELLSGNAYIHASAFLAILLGTIAGGELVLGSRGVLLIGGVPVIIAVSGYLSSRSIPAAPPPDPGLSLSFNLWRDTSDLIRQARQQRQVFLCILGISWFWLIGSLLLAQIPSFAKDVLRADDKVVVLFLTIFAAGIAVGSLLCSRWMHGAIHAKPVPLAALGMTVFAIRLAMTGSHAVTGQDTTLMGAADFLRQPGNWVILLDFFLLAVCGGLYSVPLYTLLQKSADRTRRARAMACNNLVNALFMVAAAGLAVGMLKLHFTIPHAFLTVGIINLFAAIYISKLLPFSLVGAFLRLIYRVRVEGIENYAKAGERVLIVANHTSLLDAALIASFLPDRVTFAINTFISRRFWVRPLLSLVDTLTVDPTNPFAAKALIETLRKDGKCMIFPEGRITITGSLMKIYEGPGMIADKAGAMILPVRIEGAQYTPFSYLRGKVRIRWFPKITLTILPPRRFDLPEDVKGRRRRQLAGEQLYDLMANMIFESSRIDSTLMKTLLEARRIHGRGHIIVEDPLRKPLTYGQFLIRTFIFARLIKRFVAKDENRIGLMLPNVASTALAFFAIQALGRVTAMINFSSGPSQVGGSCRCGTLRTVITSERFVSMAKLQAVLEVLKAAGVRVLYLEDMGKDLRLSDKLLGLLYSFMPEMVLRWTVTSEPHDPAVLLFTSGSEGTPKGVVLSHRNILANRFQLASAIDFGPQDIIFNCLPMFHAFGLTGGTLLPLLSGIRTFFYPSPLHYRIVPEMIYETNATIIFGTDTFLAGYARFAHPYDCHSLRYVFAGAERLKEETRSQWIEKFGRRVLEGYGATETAPVMSVNTAMHYRKGTVGRLLPGITARLETVPGIEEGKQLYVRGPNVMLGYLKEDSPGVLQPLADGWYDTGDVVSMDTGGYVTILGRIKRFAKIGGEMISLAAVEAVVAALWPEKNHAVVSVPDTRKGEALVLLTEKRDASVDSLREAFRSHGLSELWIPRRLIGVDKLPLLGTGKTDYVRAREMAMAKSS